MWDSNDSLPVMHEKTTEAWAMLTAGKQQGGKRQLTEEEWTYQVAFEPKRKKSFIILSNTPPTASRPIAAS